MFQAFSKDVRDFFIEFIHPNLKIRVAFNLKFIDDFLDVLNGVFQSFVVKLTLLKLLKELFNAINLFHDIID